MTLSKVFTTGLFIMIATVTSAQTSHMFGMVGDSRIFINKGLYNRIKKTTGVDQFSILREMIGPFYKFRGQKWGVEAAVSANWFDSDNTKNWDISHSIGSMTLNANYNLGKVLIADQLLIHTGFDLISYDVAMRDNSTLLSAPNQPNGFFWSNVSIGLNMGIETIDYLTDDGIFYNLRLGYTYMPNSEWIGTPETYKSSLEYIYIGLGFGYDSGFKVNALRK